MSRPQKQTFRAWTTLLLGMAVLGLSACTTTTIRPVTDNYSAITAPGMAAAGETGTTNMEKLSHEQLISAGQAYLERSNIQLAKLHYGMALQKQPNSIAALTGLGNALYREGQLEAAQHPLKTALDLDPQCVQALLPLGKIKLKKEEFSEALRYLKAAATFAPDNPAILTDLAITYDTIGREAEAQPLHERVIELRPTQSAAYNNLGFNFLLQEKYRQAISCFAKALQFDKHNTRARNNMAAAYALLGEEKQAYFLLQGTVGEAGAYNDLGYLYMTAGKWDKAEQSFRRALEANPRFYLRSQENLQELERLKKGLYN